MTKFKKIISKKTILIGFCCLYNTGAHAKEINMWREPAPIIKEGKHFSIIQDNGNLQKAVKGSSNMFFFSEKGAGAKPLVLIGTPIEIIEYLKKNNSSGIVNNINELPEIFIGISSYKPQKRFKGYFPIHDVLSKSIEQIVALAPAGTYITDIASIPSDLKEVYKSIHSMSDEKKSTGEKIYIKFSYLEEPGMKKIGTKSISFEQVLTSMENL